MTYIQYYHNPAERKKNNVHQLHSDNIYQLHHSWPPAGCVLVPFCSSERSKFMPPSCRSYTSPPSHFSIHLNQIHSPKFSGQMYYPAGVTTLMAITCLKTSYLVVFFVFICS